MPGIAVKRDLTTLLADQGFFPSFNIPYFEEIFQIANYTEASKNQTSNSYYENPRYLIFNRESKGVSDLKSFRDVMRLNNYKDEEFSNDPGVQVFSRYDLRENNPKAFGGLDTKITSAWRALENMSFWGVWSPQYETNEAWDFDSDLNVGKFNHINHDGLPSKWQFAWRSFSGQNYSRCDASTSKDDCFKMSGCGWCTYDTHCYVGSKSGPALGVECIAGWVTPIEEKKGALAIIIPVTAVSFLFCFAIYGYNIYLYVKNKKQQNAYSQIN